MTNPNAIEKLGARQIEDSVVHAGLALSDKTALRIWRECLAALDAAGYEIRRKPNT